MKTRVIVLVVLLFSVLPAFAGTTFDKFLKLREMYQRLETIRTSAKANYKHNSVTINVGWDTIFIDTENSRECQILTEALRKLEGKQITDIEEELKK